MDGAEATTTDGAIITVGENLPPAVLIILKEAALTGGLFGDG
jgi:hypothetical protein